MLKSYVALVERTEKWDRSKPAFEQEGFAEHAAYMEALEKSGMIAMAGLLAESELVLFVMRANDIDEVRAGFAGDPMQQSGLARVIRLEEAQFRIGTPEGTGPG
ncbi:YciI family protein [Croceibacterium aestuarii]|uniref:YciI family protein n=1 Tax=Croceibacterium aestuarii TaxID=3064139 RepID=UPI00272DDFE2|nr:YciI family protein [Croceibacterium sp. D39]